MLFLYICYYEINIDLLLSLFKIHLLSVSSVLSSCIDRFTVMFPTSMHALFAKKM